MVGVPMMEAFGFQQVLAQVQLAMLMEGHIGMFSTPVVVMTMFIPVDGDAEI